MNVSDVPPVILEKGEAVCRIRLNRPAQANALNDAAVDALLAALGEVMEQQPALLVISGEGQNFCGGFDFNNYENLSEGDLVLRFLRIEQFLQIIRRAPFDTLALVDGAAMGAGADIVAACNRRVGSSRSRFAFPGFRFGVALGTKHLAEAVGTRNARELLLSSEAVGASTALSLGLLTQIAEASKFDELVEVSLLKAQQFDRVALSRLLAHSASVAASADEELGILARSLSTTGLHRRIGKYRASRAR